MRPSTVLPALWGVLLWAAPAPGAYRVCARPVPDDAPLKHLM